MFGKHTHTPVRDNRFEPNQMICSDPKCNALLGPAPEGHVEDESQDPVEEQGQETEQPMQPVNKVRKILPAKKPAPKRQPVKAQEPIELTKDEVLQMSIKRWGPALQINQAVQESAELIHALTDALRGQPDLENISEEIADVEIMLAQMKIVYNNKDQVKAYKVAKLQKLAEILLAPADEPEETEQDLEDDEED